MAKADQQEALEQLRLKAARAAATGQPSPAAAAAAAAAASRAEERRALRREEACRAAAALRRLRETGLALLLQRLFRRLLLRPMALRAPHSKTMRLLLILAR